MPLPLERTHTRLLAPWALAAAALGGMMALAALLDAPRDYFGLLHAPFFTIWFLAVAILARRALQWPGRVRGARAAGVGLLGALLAAPVLWRAASSGGWSSGSTRWDVLLLALFLAGETMVALSVGLRLLSETKVAYRTVVAMLSLAVLVTPPAVGTIKLGILQALLITVAAVAGRYLSALEDRFVRSAWWIRVAVLLIAGALVLPLALSRDGGPLPSEGASVRLLRAGLFSAGAMVGYSALAFVASDLIGRLTRSFRSVRTRMVVLGVIAAAVGFALRDFSLLPLLVVGEGDERHRALVTSGFSLAVSCLVVWVFAVAMASRLSRSLERSVAALAAIREGNLSVTLPEVGEDELSEVARTFNAMVAQLREAEFLERINTSLQTRSTELQSTLQALRTAQADLVRAERMASVATLVRGIAHELNNPIGFIAGNVPVLRRYCDFLAAAASALSDGKPRSASELRALTELTPSKDLSFVIHDLSRMTDDITEGARRARLIISDLQDLTATSQRAVEEIDLHRVVRQSLALLAPRLGASIRVETELGPIPRLAARAGQLEQVLVNLLDNAIRAVGPSGTIRVHVGLDGSDVRLSVSDDGAGMSEEVRRQAFEPFFTTRAAGEGSGLGLAIVASIVRGHRGTIEVRSAPGQGTEVTIRLPAVADASAVAELASPSFPRRRSERR